MSAKAKSVPKPTRYDVEVQARFRVIGTMDWMEGNLVNLSQTGLCLKTQHEMQAEQLVEFLIETSDELMRVHQRKLLARIVWRRHSRYGCQFLRDPKP